MDERKFRVWIEVEEALPDGNFTEHSLMLDAAEVGRFRTVNDAVNFGNTLQRVGDALYRRVPPPPVQSVAEVMRTLAGADQNRLVVVETDGWYRYVHAIHLPEADGGEGGYQAVTLIMGDELDPRDGRLYAD